MGYRALVLGSFLAAGLAPTADAQDTAPRPEADRDAEARRLFEAGRTAFESSLYEVALSCFRRSFELSGRPALLYNIGIVAQRLGRVDEALAAFERFEREAPDDPERADVLARIEVLRDVRERSPAPASSRVGAPTPRRSGSPDAAPAALPARARSRPGRRASAQIGTGPDTRRRRPTATVRSDRRDPAGAAGSPVSTPSGADPWPWVSVAGGALAVASAVVLLVASSTDASAVEDAADGTRWADVDERAGRAPGLFVAGQITLGAGIAAIAAGVSWWLLDLRASARHRSRASLHIDGLRIRGTF